MSLEEFQRQIMECGVLSGDDAWAVVAAILEDQQPADSETLARLLVKRGVLTAFQAKSIYNGKGKSLVLGNYVVLDKLGQGGMGAVFKAEHRRMHRIVALKVLSPNVVKSAELRERFQREVRVAARLEHPNIVTAYDADEAFGTHFLVMQYVEGHDLSALVKARGPMSVKQAVDCMVQAARGLQYAHEQGIIHRDIKPSNLLLDKSGVVKILDMGLARIDSAGENENELELTSTGAVMGTVDYMAPEQAVSTKNADARSDQYSLGLSLWYLLTGRPAYGGDSLTSKLLAHRDAPIPSLILNRPDAPPALEIVFQTMVAKQPENRFVTLGVAAEALATCLTENAAAAFTTSFIGHVQDSRLPSGGQMVGSKAPTLRGTAASMPEAWSEATFTTDATNIQVGPPLSRLQDAGKSLPSWKKRMALLSIGCGAVLTLLLLVMNRSQPHNGKRSEHAPAALSTAAAIGRMDEIHQERPLPSSFVSEVRNVPPEEGPDYALAFDGMDDYVHIPTLNALMDGPVTVEMFMKVEPRAYPDSYAAQIVQGGDSRTIVQNKGEIFAAEGTRQFRFARRDYPPGEWLHVAAIYGDTPQVYVNGQPGRFDPQIAPRQSKSGLDGFSISTLPKDWISPPERYMFKGQIRGVQVTSGAKFSSEFSVPERLIADADTLALYLFKEGAGNVLYDSSGHNHHGTISGNPSWVPLASGRISSIAAWHPTPEQQAFFDEVAKLPVDEQATAVLKKLQEVNPGFHAEPTQAEIEVTDGKVIKIGFLADLVTDIWPVRALPDLQGLTCRGTDGGSQAKFRDLSPLAGMKLTALACRNTQVSDLSPLIGMPLTWLDCSNTSVDSLSPLSDMPLTRLHCGITRISDLSPLQGMPLVLLDCRLTRVQTLAPLAGAPLTRLECYGIPISDLSPLAGMKLTYLDIAKTKVSDLSPLAGMPLTQLHFYSTPIADLSPLKDAPLTVVSGNVTQISDLSPLAGMKLTTLNVGSTRVTDLSVVKGMPLTELDCSWQQVSDLSLFAGMPLQKLLCVGDPITDLTPLQGMPLSDLSVNHTQVADLSPLKDIRSLTSLNVGKTLVSDLSPLQGMSLTHLKVYSTFVEDLSPLAGMPLVELNVANSPITDLSPLKGAPLQKFHFDGTLVSDLSPLSGMRLTDMRFTQTRVSDLTPLAGMPLQSLAFQRSLISDLKPLASLSINTLGILQPQWFDESTAATLQSLPGLSRMTPAFGEYLPANEFWREHDLRKQAAMDFVKVVSARPVEEQPPLVAGQLRERNNGLEISLSEVIHDGLVQEVRLSLSDRYIQDVDRPDPDSPNRKLKMREYDLSPLLAFTHLKKLTIAGGPYWLDLAILATLPLEEIVCAADVATKNRDLFRSMTTLKIVNGRPVQELQK